MAHNSTSGQTVFITGASSGIGYAASLAFARSGYRVAGTSRSIERLMPLQTEIAPIEGADFLPLAADVQDRESIQQAVLTALDQFGTIDVLIANAGVGHRGSITESSWEDVETLLRTNIDGVLHSIRAVVPHMQQQKSGHIVLVSSITYNMIVPYAAYYAASKAFVSSIGRSLRLELEQDHIAVTDMVLGRTATNFDQNRLGGQRSGQNVPNMTPDQVAKGMVKAVHQKKRTVTLRLFDRLVLLGNILIPERIGRIALKQYR